MAKYLLDTTALIDHLRGRQEVVKVVRDLVDEGHQLGACCVNIAELYSGLREKDQTKADRFVDSLEVYEVTREIAKQAGRYRFGFARKGITLSIADTIVAAAAISHSATLITANVRDYPMEEISLLEQP